MRGKINKVIEKCKEVGVYNTIKGSFKRIYFSSLRKRFNFEYWHVSPIEHRKYALGIVDMIVSHLEDDSTIVEIGCGLGEILDKIAMYKKLNNLSLIGYDISPQVVGAAQNLFKKDSISYRVGSFGVGEDLSFDEEIIDKYDAIVYAFDPTPRAMLYVQQKMKDKANFRYYSIALGGVDGITTFFLPSTSKVEPSGSVFRHNGLTNGSEIEVSVKRLNTIASDLNVKHIDILKMDIEGSEFAVLNDVLESNIIFDQLCCEFHERIFADGKDRMRATINRLCDKGFVCCYVSPSGYEATFVRKALISG